MFCLGLVNAPCRRSSPTGRNTPRAVPTRPLDGGDLSGGKTIGTPTSETPITNCESETISRIIQSKRSWFATQRTGLGAALVSETHRESCACKPNSEAVPARCDRGPVAARLSRTARRPGAQRPDSPQPPPNGSPWPCRRFRALRPGTGRGPAVPDRATSRRAAASLAPADAKWKPLAQLAFPRAATGDQSRPGCPGPRDVPARSGQARPSQVKWKPLALSAFPRAATGDRSRPGLAEVPPKPCGVADRIRNPGRQRRAW